MDVLSDSTQGYLIWLSVLSQDDFAELLNHADSVISNHLEASESAAMSSLDMTLLQRACICFYISLPSDFCPFPLQKLLDDMETDARAEQGKISFLYTEFRRFMAETILSRSTLCWESNLAPFSSTKME